MGHNYTIPTERFQIDDLIGKELHSLEQTDTEGTFRLSRTPHPANEIIRSAAPVSGIVSNREVRTHGTLGSVADKNGNVFVVFGHTRLCERVQETACAELDGIKTPPSDEERFRDV